MPNRHLNTWKNVYGRLNFGLIDVDWDLKLIKLQIHGEKELSHSKRLSLLIN